MTDRKPTYYIRAIDSISTVMAAIVCVGIMFIAMAVSASIIMIEAAIVAWAEVKDIFERYRHQL